MVESINFVSLHVFVVLFFYFSIKSVMPVTREQKRGERAWKECFWFRNIGHVCITIVVINSILWIWFPVKTLSLPLFPNPWIGAGIGIIIIIPCSIFLAKILKDAGIESWWPKKETTLHRGIYQHIRHPGIVGEMPMYITIGFFINSLFILLWMTGFVLLYTPLYIYFEEKDLEKRFGDHYREYKKTTGMLFPKLKKTI